MYVFLTSSHATKFNGLVYRVSYGFGLPGYDSMIFTIDVFVSGLVVTLELRSTRLESQARVASNRCIRQRKSLLGGSVLRAPTVMLYIARLGTKDQFMQTAPRGSSIVQSLPRSQTNHLVLACYNAWSNPWTTPSIRDVRRNEPVFILNMWRS